MRVIAAAIFVFIGFILLGGLAPTYIGSIGTAAAMVILLCLAHILFNGLRPLVVYYRNLFETPEDLSAHDSEPPWVAELDERDTHFASLAALQLFLKQLERLDHGRIFVFRMVGTRPFRQRLMGMNRRMASPCFAMEWTDGFASLIFHDDAWSEYRAIDHDHPVSPNEDVRTRISHGENRPHPINECMLVSRAFSAINSYTETLSRPTWLSYKYVG
jgi:hypothetical protein